MKKARKAAGAGLCPCGSGLSYALCCGRLHAGEAAPDARALMASRYSAYALGLEDYVRQTWASEHCPESLDLKQDPIRWLGLEILRFEETGPESAVVEYVARGRPGGGSAFRLHEVSRFEKRDGRWLYVDGDILDK